MSHTFYAEDLGVDEILAKRVAGFMGLSSRFCCTIINPKTWSEHGHVRVYFELWSQNRLNPIDKLDVRGGSYYCAVNNEVYLKFFLYGRYSVFTLSQQCAKNVKGSFSGAKTRGRVYSFSEAFYEEKESWC